MKNEAKINYWVDIVAGIAFVAVDVSHCDQRRGVGGIGLDGLGQFLKGCGEVALLHQQLRLRNMLLRLVFRMEKGLEVAATTQEYCDHSQKNELLCPDTHGILPNTKTLSI